MNSHYRLALVLGLLFAAGCGQKGPLYLPGDPSLIKTEVPPPVQNQTEEDEDEDDDEESQDEN
jgi:predicted small lipoprotein YifL